MIPTKALSLRAYLRDIGRLDLPPLESSEKYLDRIKHARRDRLKEIRAAQEAKEIKICSNL
jgi:hypothetical protein